MPNQDSRKQRQILHSAEKRFVAEKRIVQDDTHVDWEDRGASIGRVAAASALFLGHSGIKKASVQL